jgi:glycosyltransferase involved in cell wall biosynthesis
MEAGEADGDGQSVNHMRAGQNPAKFASEVGKAERITVALITYIPYLGGYYADSLNVLQGCLDSLSRSKDLPFDVLVFDNGSGSETVGYLEDRKAKGLIDYLVLSNRNLGKGGAWEFIFQSAPGEIVAYADSDVAFEPGWLTAGLALLESFPRAGMVSCRPLRTAPEVTTATIAWAEGEPEAVVKRGQWISWQVFREHDINLGQPEDEVRRRYDSTQDVRIDYAGQTALAGAVHWQFLAYKRVLQELMPLNLGRPMGEVRKLDERLNQAGYLRLMTLKPYVRHMGNVWADQSAEGSQLAGPPAVSDRRGLWKSLLNWQPVRRLLLSLHSAIFNWYFRD